MQHYCKHSSERWDGHWQQLMLMMCGRQYLRMETAHAALINTVITMKVCVFLCCIGPSSENTAPQSRANPGSNQGADNWASTWIHSASRRRRKNLEQFKLVPLCLHKRNICSASEPFFPPPFPSFLFFLLSLVAPFSSTSVSPFSPVHSRLSLPHTFGFDWMWKRLFLSLPLAFRPLWSRWSEPNIICILNERSLKGALLWNAGWCNKIRNKQKHTSSQGSPL